MNWIHFAIKYCLRECQIYLEKFTQVWQCSCEPEWAPVLLTWEEERNCMEQVTETCWQHPLGFSEHISSFTLFLWLHRAVHVFGFGGCSCKLYNLLFVPQQASISTSLTPLHLNRIKFGSVLLGTCCEFVMTQLKGRKCSIRESLIIAHLGLLNQDWISDIVLDEMVFIRFCFFFRILWKTILQRERGIKKVFCFGCTWILLIKQHGRKSKALNEQFLSGAM